MIYTVNGFDVINKADVFMELSCFFDDATDVDNLISGSSAFSKSSLDVWKFSVHVTLKSSMQDFEHNLTSMGDECHCPMISTFLNSILPGIWDED